MHEERGREDGGRCCARERDERGALQPPTRTASPASTSATGRRSRSHARRYLRDPRDADEVVQEAFLRLFLAMPELETELQALAYCRRTITNLCIDRYRADARRPRLVALEGTPAEDLPEHDAGDPVVRAEDAALVRAALSQLPELHRRALVKREIEEKPLPVIADELDVAEDSVKHLLFRARRHLRKLLAGTSVAPGVDAELTRGLRGRGASGGAAGLLLLALLGLGSGPDLRSVPVVGVDLPDVLGVIEGRRRGERRCARRRRGARPGGDGASAAGGERAQQPGQPLAGGAAAGRTGRRSGRCCTRQPGLGAGHVAAVDGRLRTALRRWGRRDHRRLRRRRPARRHRRAGPSRSSAPGPEQRPAWCRPARCRPAWCRAAPCRPARCRRVPARRQDAGRGRTCRRRAHPCCRRPGATCLPARPSCRAPPARPGAPDDSAVRGADKAAEKAAERAADVAEKARQGGGQGRREGRRQRPQGAEKAADKAAEKARTRPLSRPPTRPTRPLSRPPTRRRPKARRTAAEKAAKDAEKAAKDAEKAADRAAKAAADRAAAQRQAAERAAAEQRGRGPQAAAAASRAAAAVEQAPAPSGGLAPAVASRPGSVALRRSRARRQTADEGPTARQGLQWPPVTRGVA